MPKTFYINLNDINELQTNIMDFVEVWVHTRKTPIPQREIIIAMKNAGIGDSTTVSALNVLLKKGYIRRAYTSSNKTTYVQLRKI